MRKGVSLDGRLSQIIEELIDKGITLEQAKREFERKFLTAALRVTSGNVGRAAKTLGIHRNTLRNKLQTAKEPVQNLAVVKPRSLSRH